MNVRSISEGDRCGYVASCSWIQILGIFHISYRTRNKDRVLYTHCLFHQERTPSLFMWEQSGQFFCHGCHAQGDKVDFLYTAGKGGQIIRDINELAELFSDLLIKKTAGSSSVEDDYPEFDFIKNF